LPELRKDPITGRWVIIASDRSRRPSDFVRSPVKVEASPLCPFCAGHEQRTPAEVLAYRNGSAPNGPGWHLRVVPNKFPALRVEGDIDRQGDGLYDRMNGVGAHELIIECPDHELTLANQTEKSVENVFWAFRERVLDLKKDFRLRYVMLFKNHGDAAGASLSHSHSQLIALPVVPKQVLEELDGSRRYYEYKERCIYCDIVRQELADGSRLIMATDHFVVIAPYAPRFPFETWIVPRKHVSHFENADPAILPNLAWVMRTLLRQIDKALEMPAYNFVVHSAAAQDGPLSHYHWHIEIIPRLSRVAGFEWGTGFYINPTPPEEAAKFLRDVGLV
jgi:UDPglucose--hexose-1-phosphate uridylyltransferase